MKNLYGRCQFKFSNENSNFSQLYGQSQWGAAMAADGTFDSYAAIAIAFLCTGTAVAIATWQIVMHLRNYTEPTYQRYIVRIIFMVPVRLLSPQLPSLNPLCC